jgi:hypothetical protein
MMLDIQMPGRPRPFRGVGRVRDDDSIELRGAGLAPDGKAVQHVLTGRFSSGNSFTAQADPPFRPCTCQLAREPRSP